MKVTAFPLAQQPCPIQPGRPDRDWMDAFQSRQPYRCLPLVIANTSGWEILTPVAFRAIWDGGPHVKIEAPFGVPPQAPHKFVHSHFGGGTITFHTDWLFRTPEGWDMFVSGPPNTIKHGITALNGVVETWWLPQHFTMNWRFTAPGSVEFAKHEPFCFIMPIPHKAIDECELVVKDLAKEPELHGRNQQWRKSVDDFIVATKDRDVTDPDQAWQRNYLKGQYPDGTPGPEDHVHRRRVKPPRMARDDE